MKIEFALISAAAIIAASPALAADTPTDPQIAHIAYTAGTLDIEAGKQALAQSKNSAVRGFAEGAPPPAGNARSRNVDAAERHLPICRE